MESHSIKDIEIILNGLPMPPSVNKAYGNNNSGSGRGRYKTQDYQVFEGEMNAWRLINLAYIGKVRAALKTLTTYQALELTYLFKFEVNKIVTKVGVPKRNDTANRLKIFDDGLSKMINVDDSLFWNLNVKKHAITNPGSEKERVDVRIRVIDIVW